MANNNNTGLVGTASDIADNMRDTLFGAEGFLGDINMLGITRPLAQIGVLAELKEQGGILQGLRTGAKKLGAARKGGSSPAQKRYRPPTNPPAPRQPTGQGVLTQPDEVDLIL